MKSRASTIQPGDYSMNLTKEQIAELVAQAREHSPYETCGLIGGKDGRAVHIYPIKNIAPDRVKRYLMEPQEQFTALSDIDKNGWDVLAIYHSHPATQAYPSQTDVNDAYDPTFDEELYPGTNYILISLANPEMAQVRAYEFNHREITEITVQVEERVENQASRKPRRDKGVTSRAKAHKTPAKKGRVARQAKSRKAR